MKVEYIYPGFSVLAGPELQVLSPQSKESVGNSP